MLKLLALGNSKEKNCFPFEFHSFFRNFAVESAKLLHLGIKNE